MMVEGDCLQIINILSDGSSSLASFGALLDSCLLLRSNFDVLSFHFVKRVGNLLAHALASNASLSGLEGTSLPSEVCSTN